MYIRRQCRNMSSILSTSNSVISCDCYRKVQASENDRQRQLRKSKTRQACAHRQGGGHQDNRQDAAEPWLAAEVVQRGESQQPGV